MKNHTTITRHQEDKRSKATYSLFPIEMIEKLEWTQSRIITESHNGSNNQQQINNDRSIALEQTAPKGTGVGGGLNEFYRYQIFALCSSVVEAQKC